MLSGLRSILTLCAALCALAPLPASSAQGGADSASHAAKVDDLAELLRPIRERNDVPALAAAVVLGGRTVALGVDGLRKRGSPERVERGDRWHLGSCTKSIAATWIATFVDEGKLDWSTTIGAVFAGHSAEMDAAWKPVTIEELLAHRGGAPHNLDADGLWLRLWNAQGTPVEQRRMLVDGVLHHPPAAAPGTKFEYSNAGVALAASMVEKLAGVDWEGSVRERVFVPLGMDSAGFGAPGTREHVDEPRGHTLRGAPVEIGPGDDNPAAISPAGKVHASIGDWAKYVAFHLDAIAGRQKLLTPATAKRIHEPFALAGGASDASAYGFGWGFGERSWAGGRVLTHSGSNTMWYCVVWIAPTKGFAVLVASNQGGDRASKACDEVAALLVEQRFGKGDFTPSRKP